MKIGPVLKLCSDDPLIVLARASKESGGGRG